MGQLRVEPKTKEPGFIKLKLKLAEQDVQAETEPPKADGDSFEATIRLVTRQATAIHISREMPLKQVARHVRMLDGRLGS